MKPKYCRPDRSIPTTGSPEKAKRRGSGGFGRDAQVTPLSVELYARVVRARWSFEPASRIWSFVGSIATVVSLWVPRAWETSTWTPSGGVAAETAPAESATANAIATPPSSTSQESNRLDMRRVRKHVDRPNPLEPVAPRRSELFDVRRKGGRVAGDVDDPLRLEAADPPQRFAREARAGWIDDDDVRVARPFLQLGKRLPHFPREEGRVRDPVQVGVLDRAGDRLLRDLDSPNRERLVRKREPDRADPAVEVVHGLLAGHRGVLAGELVQALSHRRVRLQERVRPHAETQAAQLLLDRILAPEQRRRQVRDLRGRLVDGPVDRAHLGKAAQHLDELLALESLARCGDELDERLARVPALPEDEVTQIALVCLLVVRGEPLLASPVADGVPDRVAEVGRQPATLDLQHLVPTPGPVEAERRAGRRLGERVLELVSVVKDRLGRNDRLERRLCEPADAAQCVGYLGLLRGDLSVVGEILEPAATASRVVRTRRVDALRPRLEHLHGERLRVAALDLRDRRANRVAGQTAAHEDDEAVQPRNAVPAVGERVDVELELLVFRDGRGHEASLAAASATT